MAETTAPKPFVFILMPFAPEFNDVYELGIKAACKDAGTHCERVDEQIFQESILEHIYNQISKADVIVADMTGRNPNVFYEAGYAHALGKTVILLTQNADDIPFDLKHYPHIIYGGKITELKAQLEKRIGWIVAHPKEALSAAEASVEFLVGGTKLVDGVMVSFPHDVKDWHHPDTIRYIWQLDVHNTSPITLEGVSRQFALITPTGFPFSTERAVSLPDGRGLHILEAPSWMFPDGWAPVSISFFITERSIRNRAVVFNAALRVFSDVGVKDIDFLLNCNMTQMP